jgi:hypothetical protein
MSDMHYQNNTSFANEEHLGPFVCKTYVDLSCGPAVLPLPPFFISQRKNNLIDITNKKA